MTRDGGYTMVMFTDEYLGAYGLPGATVRKSSTTSSSISSRS
jgi:hypothetical protein